MLSCIKIIKAKQIIYEGFARSYTGSEGRSSVVTGCRRWIIQAEGLRVATGRLITWQGWMTGNRPSYVEDMPVGGVVDFLDLFIFEVWWGVYVKEASWL